jgi:metallophosphoesterase (TIGR00282 family)
VKILYIGDIMGAAGIKAVGEILPKLKNQYELDLVIAQGENVSQGKGIIPEDYNRLKDLGVDFLTGGNWTIHKPEIWPLLKNAAEPIIRPANYKFVTKSGNKTIVISLLGQIVGRDSDKPMHNPLKVIDKILEENKNQARDATIVNFHGDYSSEKVIIGHYLDGKVSAVVGDHWHVPTADARVLEHGTAHITDVGMCGILNASLGVSLESVIPRWRNGIHTPNTLEEAGAYQFNAVLIDVNDNGLADKLTQIQEYLS